LLPSPQISTDCIPSLAEWTLAAWTIGPRAQYLPPNRSQFVFYSAHTADHRHVCLQTKSRKKV